MDKHFCDFPDNPAFILCLTDVLPIVICGHHLQGQSPVVGDVDVRIQFSNFLRTMVPSAA